MDLEIERLEEAMRTSFVYADNVSSMFVADSSESGKHGVVVLGWESVERIINLLLSSLSWTNVARKVQMLSADVLFEIRFCTESTTASTAAIPGGNTLRANYIGLSTDELLLLCMNASLVDDEITLLGKATTATRMIADVVAAIFNITVLNLKMCLEVAVRGANVTTLRAGRRVNGFDVLLHLNVCREANCIDKSVLV